MFDRAAELRRKRNHLQALREEFAQQRETCRAITGRISTYGMQLRALNVQAVAANRPYLNDRHEHLAAHHQALKAEKAACTAALADLRQQIAMLDRQIRDEEATLLHRGRRTR